MSTYNPASDVGAYVWIGDTDGLSGMVVRPDIGLPCLLASAALSAFTSTKLAPGTIDAYRKGALRFLASQRRLMPTVHEDDLLRWPTQQAFDTSVVSHLKKPNYRMEASTTEAGVTYVEAPEDAESETMHDLCGIFHLAAMLQKLGAISVNFMEVPFGERKKKLVGSIANKGSQRCTVEPKFRYRMRATVSGQPRTESALHLPYIIPALEDFGAPTGVILQTEVAIDAGLRRAERPVISIWDYHNPSQFDDVIDCRNKGGGPHTVKHGVIVPSTIGKIWYFGEGERQALDSNNWTLTQWSEYLNDSSVDLKVRRSAAMKEPLFPTKKGKFMSASGPIDTWYRPAMRKAGLPTWTHYTRHCLVHLFLDWVEAQIYLSEIERNNLRVTFARGMGWAWPEMMLAVYSLPQRRNSMLEVSRKWNSARPEWIRKLSANKLAMSSLTRKVSDPQLSRLSRFAMEKVA